MHVLQYELRPRWTDASALFSTIYECMHMQCRSSDPSTKWCFKIWLSIWHYVAQGLSSPPDHPVRHEPEARGAQTLRMPSHMQAADILSRKWEDAYCRNVMSLSSSTPLVPFKLVYGRMGRRGEVAGSAYSADVQGVTQ